MGKRDLAIVFGGIILGNDEMPEQRANILALQNYKVSDRGSALGSGPWRRLTLGRLGHDDGGPYRARCGHLRRRARAIPTLTSTSCAAPAGARLRVQPGARRRRPSPRRWPCCLTRASRPPCPLRSWHKPAAAILQAIRGQAREMEKDLTSHPPSRPTGSVRSGSRASAAPM
jgi:hypothetical protein